MRSRRHLEKRTHHHPPSFPAHRILVNPAPPSTFLVLTTSNALPSSSLSTGLIDNPWHTIPLPPSPPSLTNETNDNGTVELAALNKASLEKPDAETSIAIVGLLPFPFPSFPGFQSSYPNAPSNSLTTPGPNFLFSALHCTITLHLFRRPAREVPGSEGCSHQPRRSTPWSFEPPQRRRERERGGEERKERVACSKAVPIEVLEGRGGVAVVVG